jgi:hypothetical protein
MKRFILVAVFVLPLCAGALWSQQRAGAACNTTLCMTPAPCYYIVSAGSTSVFELDVMRPSSHFCYDAGTGGLPLASGNATLWNRATTGGAPSCPFPTAGIHLGTGCAPGMTMFKNGGTWFQTCLTGGN